MGRSCCLLHRIGPQQHLAAMGRCDLPILRLPRSVSAETGVGIAALLKFLQTQFNIDSARKSLITKYRLDGAYLAEFRPRERHGIKRRTSLFNTDRSTTCTRTRTLQTAISHMAT